MGDHGCIEKKNKEQIHKFATKHTKNKLEMSDKHELKLQNMSPKDTALLMKHVKEKLALSKEPTKELSALKEYHTAEKTPQHQDYNKTLSQYTATMDTLHHKQ